MKHCYKVMRGLLVYSLTLLLILIQSEQAELKAQALAPTLKGLIENEKGDPLQDVTIKIENQQTNFKKTISTDNRGIFSLSDAQLAGQLQITISHVGYATQQLTRSNLQAGKTESIYLQLRDSTSSLNEVVVTALGIKKEEKAIGYAAQTVSSQEINDARSNNFANALSGKVAGLTMVSPGSGPLNSVRISLRGDASLNPEGNNALIVLDGVPMNSNLTSSGVSNAYQAGSGNDVPVDFGNGISDINPDDIESITVLKGPSATALYGSRAANGALLITTKSGAKKSKGIGITFNSNTSVNDILKWPDFQYEYGQGTGTQRNTNGDKYYSYGASEDGASTSGTSSAFGPRFDGQLYYQYDPSVEGRGAERTLWRPYRNNIKDFWRTGYTLSNNLSIEGGSERGSARASITHTKNEWIMPNTGFERITAAVSLNFKASDKLRISSKVNFTNKISDNLPATGYNNQSISYFMIFQNPNVDLNWYRPIWKRGQNQIDQVHPFSSFIDNPFLIAYEMTNRVKSNQVVGNLSANYTISKKFEFMVRSGIDLSMEDRQTRRPFSSANFKNGYYREQAINFYEINTDALLTYKEKLGKNFQLTASAGGNLMSRRYNSLISYVNGLVIPGVYMLANGIGTPVTNSIDRNKNLNSLYALASINYQSKIFIDVTGRNDWSSTLPKQNNSFFYPSVSSSFILSELISLPTVISFAKLRLSAAQVGNDTDPYKTRKYYGTSEFPSSASVPTTLHNVNFKPEISNSVETGLDLRFFKGRLGIDLTYYNNITRNQILEAPLDPTTGYSRAVLNGGKIRNRGVELVLTGEPVKTKNFRWNSFLTWAKNQNRVLELTEGMEDKQDIGYGGNATIQARVGGTTGDIYGFGFLRSPDGQIIYTAAGLPARPQEIQYIGNAYADWKAGFRNEFSYKNFRMSILFDGQYGGIIYSQTHHKMSEQGKLKHTLRGREENFIIGEGVVMDAEGKYIPNITKVLPHQYYADYYRRANVESNSFDASFIKLREARIEYNLPMSWIRKTSFQQVSLALYGRDLWMWTEFPIFDPETAALNGSTILPGIEMGQMPTQRTFGFNLTVKL
ncbi:MAG: SusC/RagA family TonB-linked outer membrane protein [Flavihumibacter sp.]|jgi:TonB-linked SusC/RagA family outer membrane protein|nr:SusC/RagA family TonB-linked outer membrane protein [Flavihumibacter sp.]